MTAEQDYQSTLLGLMDRQTAALEQMAEDVRFLVDYVLHLSGAHVAFVERVASAVRPATPETPAAQPSTPSNEPMATVTQIGELYAIGRERGKDRGAVENACRQKFGGRIPDQLTKAEAADWLKALKAKGQAT